ncbi:helix-turn-helix transcriptional regulator [Spongiactinospora sp. TRM90649]|uniref:helix-turn-helix domain-containing protein n=1 Tax=Spongiactinospora sp. TRM90649 TaxID=3031114 RepID=UPI0023F61A37|nr:helix-turn-helix transcriptional regulator [Spongiactinospora sp. TRM90649]MDF5751834.1 helix-turn-helix transcriptional regulator [Spongiactinospora sp. TRM90649]
MDLGNEPAKRATRAFATELARLREERGLAQTSLAARLQVHRSLISHIEHERKIPTRAIAEKLDRVFGLVERKHFVGLYKRILYARNSPAWFIKWLEAEKQAIMLQSWDPLVIPGLLQTSAYARAVIGSNPTLGTAEMEARVQTRLARREILNKERPPTVWVLLDENVLDRPIGGPPVLAEQLHHLLEDARDPRVTIQIVPSMAGNPAGLVSAFQIARLPNGMEVVSVDSIIAGQPSADADIVAKAKMWYEAIKADAQPQSVSLNLVEDAVRRWTKT